LLIESIPVRRAILLPLAIAIGVGVGCGGADGVAWNDADATLENPSPAMEPTFEVGDPLEVDYDAYDSDSPEIGDVVIFHPPAGANRGRCGGRQPFGSVCPLPTPQPTSESFVKRIVAGPGDRLSIRNGHAVVNGEVAEEDFISPCPQGTGLCNMPRPVTIPPDHYFLLGDNRPASDDSRWWGPVRSDWIIGRVMNAGS
jgi:signal peptidase I